MNRRLFAYLLAAALAVAPSAVCAQTKTHKVAIHVDDSDPQRINLALNNVENIQKYYAAKGETVAVEVVTYGPGLVMLRADTSPVKDRVAAMSLEYPKLRFSACENTRAGMSKREGKDVPLMKEAKPVPSGVIRLIELQEQGWSYLRPYESPAKHADIAPWPKAAPRSRASASPSSPTFRSGRARRACSRAFAIWARSRRRGGAWA